MIKWKTKGNDGDLIEKVAVRALQMELNDDKVEVMMDITAVHLNDTELDLKRLLEADDFNFAHDIIGIRRHIDVNTGKLRNCFLPRHTK